MRFFTNISHELRTPLTLIAGPIEHILQNGNLNNEEKEQLILVERNTHRMLRLVNQILDFRKIQNKKDENAGTTNRFDSFHSTYYGKFR